MTTTSQGTTLVCALALGLAAGCTSSHELGAGPEGRGAGSVREGLVHSGWLSGDMVTVGAFDADAYQIETFDSVVTLHVGALGGDDFGWAMIQLSLGEYASFAEVPPGTTLSSRGAEVFALGCSGPSHGNWDYDGPADEVEVLVSAGPEPGSRLVSFTATYGGGQHAEGGFIVDAR
ncbi:MAG: hypothetical protein EVA89_28825 [Sandaracinaceae bacterium]|nr:MAG: hypothetical protein EVA89_28825 [Sandaracinaceae bacterium]